MRRNTKGDTYCEKGFKTEQSEKSIKDVKERWTLGN